MGVRREKSIRNNGLIQKQAGVLERFISSVDMCPFASLAGENAHRHRVSPAHQRVQAHAMSHWIDKSLARFDCCPWTSSVGIAYQGQADNGRAPLYTAEQRERRDTSPWTRVQGILAPLQFAVFLVSLWFVLSYLDTGEGFVAASASIVVKTLVLYTIMVTGALWERDVFGRYLFAPAFFWEDAVSMVVIALHTAYLVALFTGLLNPEQQMILALAAYATYVVNAAQFLLKLRAARLAAPVHSGLLDAAE